MRRSSRCSAARSKASARASCARSTGRTAGTELAWRDRLFGKPDDGALDLARAVEGLKLKTSALQSLWGFGDPYGRWDADLDQGIITFTAPGRLTATAPVQVVGTYDTLDGTFLWGWDHPSVPEPCRRDAARVRAWGEAHGRADMTTRKIACTEEDAWLFVALAAHLSGGQGGYRGPSGTAHVFMTFGTVTLSASGAPPEEKDLSRDLAPAEQPEAIALVQAYQAEMFACDAAFYEQGDDDLDALDRCIAAKRAIHARLWRSDDPFWDPASAGWPSDFDPAALSGWRAYVLGPGRWRICCDRAIGRDRDVVLREALDVEAFAEGLRIVGGQL